MSQNPNQQSPLDSPEVWGFVAERISSGWTNAAIVRALRTAFELDTTKDSIRRFRTRHGLQVPGVERARTKIDGDTADVTTHVKQTSRHYSEGQAVRGEPIVEQGPNGPILASPDTLLIERGLDPEEWYIDDVSPNTWQGPIGDGNIADFSQVKFRAHRKKPYVIQPVRSDGWSPTGTKDHRSNNKSLLTVIVGDAHAPFHNLALNDVFCEWLEVNQPQRGVNLGDHVDFPDISRHPSDPENHAVVQECLQSGYDLWRDWVYSSPNTEWDFMPGNHDERIRQYLLARAPAIFDLKRVQTEKEPEQSVYSLAHLMRLDELKVNFIEPQGGYEDCQVNLSKHLAVRHGWIARKGSGSSALGTLELTNYSILIGHTHRQSIVHYTTHDIDRNLTTLLGAEIGCMCRVEAKRDMKGRRYPAYAVMPDWQQGWATAEIFADGKFRVDLATFVNGNTLLWRDQRYEV